ncbi:hypothetical protein [Mycobacteroides abscessus]|uniref:hypothetical protein n=1 Tax=Mycobacteroides abscessus TaxID=36809 RepID=UPI0018966C47|nr:hypothetical protein [Mycobacteroides abscessus]
MLRVILFVFAGRKANMQLQVPYIKRILGEHPNVEYEIWNLARDPKDGEYLQTITGERITVRNDFHGGCHWTGFNKVWWHYAQPEYRDCLFVKVDDDDVFFETARFGEYLEAIDNNRGSVVSALTVNNGASTWLEPLIWRGFENLNIPLLDVHMSGDYAAMSHEHFLTNWRDVTGQPNQVIPTTDWLSINCIGLDHPTLKRIADLLDAPSPAHIAGRDWPPGFKIGDEGAANMQPRVIHRGFVVSHLSFGPQQLPDETWDLLRRGYAKVAGEYL